jgi:hypothetical protein
VLAQISKADRLYETSFLQVRRPQRASSLMSGDEAAKNGEILYVRL